MAPDAAAARLASLAWAFHQHPDVSYLVDRDGIIRGVGRTAWVREAQDGGVPMLADPRAVLDRPLFDFIQGEDVRESYRQLMGVAAQGRRAVAIPMRCDSPDRERFMRLTITALRDGALLVGYLFQSAILHELRRLPAALHPAAPSEDAPTVGFCSYCNRVRESTSGHWMRVPEYLAEHGPMPVHIVHTLCGGCTDGVLAPLVDDGAASA